MWVQFGEPRVVDSDHHACQPYTHLACVRVCVCVCAHTFNWTVNGITTNTDHSAIATNSVNKFQL